MAGYIVDVRMAAEEPDAVVMAARVLDAIEIDSGVPVAVGFHIVVEVVIR